MTRIWRFSPTFILWALYSFRPCLSRFFDLHSIMFTCVICWNFTGNEMFYHAHCFAKHHFFFTVFFGIKAIQICENFYASFSFHIKRKNSRLRRLVVGAFHWTPKGGKRLHFLAFFLIYRRLKNSQFFRKRTLLGNPISITKFQVHSDIKIHTTKQR